MSVCIYNVYANPGVTHSDTLHSSRVTVLVTLGLTMMMLNWLAADAFEQHRSVICSSLISTLNKKQLIALLNLFILIIESVHELMGAQWLSGRVLDSRPKGRGFEPHRRHCVVSLSKNINPSLALVQPRKTRPFITERLLMGRKESNQTNKQKHELIN